MVVEPALSPGADEVGPVFLAILRAGLLLLPCAYYLGVFCSGIKKIIINLKYKILRQVQGSGGQGSMVGGQGYGSMVRGYKSCVFGVFTYGLGDLGCSSATSASDSDYKRKECIWLKSKYFVQPPIGQVVPL